VHEGIKCKKCRNCMNCMSPSPAHRFFVGVLLRGRRGGQGASPRQRDSVPPPFSSPPFAALPGLAGPGPGRLGARGRLGLGGGFLGGRGPSRPWYTGGVPGACGEGRRGGGARAGDLWGVGRGIEAELAPPEDDVGGACCREEARRVRVQDALRSAGTRATRGTRGTSSASTRAPCMAAGHGAARDPPTPHPRGTRCRRCRCRRNRCHVSHRLRLQHPAQRAFRRTCHAGNTLLRTCPPYPRRELSGLNLRRSAGNTLF